MNNRHNHKHASEQCADRERHLDRKLAAYLAATAAVQTLAAPEASAVVVSNSTVQPLGINQEVNIDFNSDGQIDYQIDHDRVNLGGTDLDYLQIDKNDVSSAANPYPINNFAVFPTNGTNPNSDHEYATDAGPGERGYYPSALLSGTEIGPLTNGWDFQEGENFADSHRIIRANRLIDEDATQIDNANTNPPPNVVGTFPPLGTPSWIGLGGQTRYLGVRIDLNDAGHASFNNDGSQYWYGWIGVRITNEANATGEVVGWGYESELGTSILAGEVAGVLGDYNGNGLVDGADYVVWRKNKGATGTPGVSEGDGVDDNVVNDLDYTFWRSHFGNTSGTGSDAGMALGSQQVPEPGSLVLSLVAALAIFGAFLARKLRRR